jgi:hypothetical protein
MNTKAARNPDRNSTLAFFTYTTPYSILMRRSWLLESHLISRFSYPRPDHIRDSLQSVSLAQILQLPFGFKIFSENVR